MTDSLIRNNEMYFVSFPQIIKDNGMLQSKSEVAIQKLFSHHPFVVGCLHAYQTKHQLFIITDYISGGELLVQWKNYSPFPENLVQIYIGEIALVLDYLHNGGVIYRDLKLENLLLDDDGHIMLTDFGFAKRLKERRRTYTICGTQQFMAPEVMTGNGYDHAVDWWSLGIIMFALLTGKFPEYVDDYNLLHENEIWFRMPEGLNPDTSSFMSKLLRRNPRLRVQGIRELKRENYFKNFKFELLLDREIKPKVILEECIRTKASTKDQLFEKVVKNQRLSIAVRSPAIIV